MNACPQTVPSGDGSGQFTTFFASNVRESPPPLLGGNGILLRDWGFEAIDARDCAIGMFTSQREAAAALQEVDMQSATVAQTVPSKPVFAKA
jgi:hypothetical protein